MVSKINPDQLVKKAVKTEVKKYVSTRKFQELALSEVLKKNLAQKGYEHPSEIQDKSIDHLMKGVDMIGIAATGTGKTGAFLIPFIEQVLQGKMNSGLVVVPTRELAQQVQTEFSSLAKGTGLRTNCFIGGTNVPKDIAKAKQRVQLTIGTPGRLLDLMQRGALRLQQTDVLILDEFDRMLDMGFIKDIQSIVATLNKRKQSLLFSATLNKSQEKLIQEIVSNPVRVQVASGSTSSDNVDQNVIHVAPHENKFQLLLNLLLGDNTDKVMLFAETKHGADKLSKQLSKSGIHSDAIHGNKSQNYRTKVIDRFKRGKLKVLVATDVAARGIDVKGVTHVINYQLPLTMESYIHRIGRTGRADATGIAYTFAN